MGKITTGQYYSANLSSEGIFNNNLQLISYECSPTLSGACEHIFNGELGFSSSNNWISQADKPYFQVTMKRGYFYPTYGAIFSCYNSYCLKKIALLGIEKGEEDFKEICAFNSTVDLEFIGKKSLYPCSFNKPLKTIKLVNRGMTNSQTTQFALYYFDFFGYLKLGKCTFHQKITISWIPGLVFFIMLI